MNIFRCLAFSALLAMSVSSANAQEYPKGVLEYAKGVEAYFTGDYQTAWNELLPLAEGGNSDAQTYIGFMYEKGAGEIINYVEAVKWYHLAADQGNATAQLNLGWIYADGKGVIQNDVMAHMWFNIASANGFEDAAKVRDKISLKMTQEAIEKAQAMAQECLSSGYKNCGD